MFARPWLSPLCGLALLGCEDPCEWSACPLYHQRAQADVETGIAGAVVLGPEDPGDECPWCRHGLSYNVRAWSRAEAQGAELNDLVDMDVAGSAETDDDGRYSLALPAGEYVVCFGGGIFLCYETRVRPGELTTLNLQTWGDQHEAKQALAHEPFEPALRVRVSSED